MKSKLLSLFIPVLAVSAIVGTGFALFQFNESQETSVNIGSQNVSLAGYSEIGTISIENAGAATLSIDADYASGIHLVYTGGQGTTDQVDFSFVLTQDEPAAESLDLTTVIEFATGLGEYIHVEAVTYLDGSSLDNTESGSGDSAITIEDTLTTDGLSDSTTFDLYTSLTFSWSAGMQPTDTDSWDALNDIINNISGDALTITYSVDFAD